MYVGHSLVIPAKDLLRAGGLPYAAATMVSLAVFVLAAFLLVRRVLRVS
jgi:hypothetical protein